MNLYQLRYFTTLAQEEHYTKAALKLHITQPSLTHAIHLLEDELDVALFEKKGRNVVLTKYGKLFLKEIEPILNRLDDSIENIKQISKGKETLNIGFVRRLGMSYIPQLISSFQNENVTFQCHSGFSYDLIHDLKKNDLDIVFCSYVDDQDIFFKPVITQEFYVIVSLNHPLAKNDEIETLIFDEIDTGISGRTAQMVSEKMHMIAEHHQVICISHLQQIAAMADAHFSIEKSVENETTLSTIRRLTEDEQVTELARMLGGVRITDTVLESAREMLNLAQNAKK